jgi:hypothetical protein
MLDILGPKQRVISNSTSTTVGHGRASFVGHSSAVHVMLALSSADTKIHGCDLVGMITNRRTDNLYLGDAHVADD